jgi:hypothetical protein
MPEPDIPGTIRLLKTKAIVSTAHMPRIITLKEPDSAARPIRGPKTGHAPSALRPCDTGSGGKHGVAAH